MSKINLILLIAVFGFCAALPVPNEEVINAEVPDEVPVESEVVNDETKQDDPSRIFRPHTNPLLNPYLNSNPVPNNLNSNLYTASIITQSPLSAQATILLNPVVPGLVGK